VFTATVTSGFEYTPNSAHKGIEESQCPVQLFGANVYYITLAFRDYDANRIN